MGMKQNNDLKGRIGVIYPVTQKNINTLKKRKKPVYVKYITHSKSRKPTRLKCGDFLLLYLSRKDRSIICYSKILSIAFKTPGEIIIRHLDKIQMSREEFMAYTRNRNEKLLLFLELKKLVELEKSYIVDYPITMAGRYVSEPELHRIIRRSK